jgi:hypothetical protein
MQWNTPLPLEIERRKNWHKVFAWWPVATMEGQTVWLEPVYRRQSFSVSDGGWCAADYRVAIPGHIQNWD